MEQRISGEKSDSGHPGRALLFPAPTAPSYCQRWGRVITLENEHMQSFHRENNANHETKGERHVRQQRRERLPQVGNLERLSKATVKILFYLVDVYLLLI